MMKKFLILLSAVLLFPHGVIYSQQKEWSLEECIKYAIENNIQIKQQIVQTEFRKTHWIWPK